MVELSKSGFAPIGVEPVLGTKQQADDRANFRVRRKRRALKSSVAQLGAGGARGRVHGISSPEVQNRYSAAFL